VPLVEHELLILLEQISSLPVFSGVRVTRSLAVCVCFLDRFILFLLIIVLSVFFFFHLQILSTTLVSSKSSFIQNMSEYSFFLN